MIITASSVSRATPSECPLAQVLPARLAAHCSRIRSVLGKRAETDLDRPHFAGPNRGPPSRRATASEGATPVRRSAVALPNRCTMPTSPPRRPRSTSRATRRAPATESPTTIDFQLCASLCSTSSSEKRPSQPSTACAAPRTRATVPVVAVRSNASSRIEFSSTRSEPSWWYSTPTSGACLYASGEVANSGHSQPVRTTPTRLTAKPKTMMFWRMMRTVSRDSRTSSGSGLSGSPIRTMSPASAAMSVPVPMAMPTPARASAGASLTPSPTNAVVPPIPLVSAFCAGSSSACTSVTGTCSATASRDGRAVAGQERDRRDAERPQIGEHPCRLGSDAVARADRAEDHAVRGDEQRRLPGRVESLQRRGSLRRKPECRALRAAGACRRPRLCRQPSPRPRRRGEPGSLRPPGATGRDHAPRCRMTRASGCSLPCSAAAAIRKQVVRLRADRAPRRRVRVCPRSACRSCRRRTR